MGKFRDDHGGALTTVIAYNAFFAFFPLLLVVVTVLGFLLGRDSGFQQRLLGSASAGAAISGSARLGLSAGAWSGSRAAGPSALMVALAAVPEDGCPLDWLARQSDHKLPVRTAGNRSWLLR
jgi:hypothetical protein